MRVDFGWTGPNHSERHPTDSTEILSHWEDYAPDFVPGLMERYSVTQEQNTAGMMPLYETL